MKKRLNADIQKPKIVKQFHKTILAEGFEGASIAKVAKRMKIHPSLILHYFGNKENLTLALVDFVIDEYGSLLRQFREREDGHKDRLTRLLEAIWSREYYEKIQVDGSFSVLAVSFRNEKIHEKIKYLYHMFRKFLVREFTFLADNGQIRINDPDHAAEIIMTMIEGSRHFRGFIIGDDQMDRYNRDMIAVARQFLTGEKSTRSPVCNKE